MKKQSSSATAKKATVSAPRKATAKPAAAPKPVAKKAVVKKPAKQAVKAAAKKPIAVKAKPAPVKALTAKKPVASSKNPVGIPQKTPKANKKQPVSTKTPINLLPPKPPKEKKLRFGADDLDFFRRELLTKRDVLTGQTSVMRRNALERTDEDNIEEDGTDSFNRLFVLEQAGTQQHQIVSIDEALRAIEKGHYGVCDCCGELIGKARLTALPFATSCIACAQAKEKSRTTGRHF